MVRTALFLSLALAACGGDPGGSTPPRPPHAASPSPALSLLHDSTDIDGHRVGPPAPGMRATAVVVFASWCSPCRHELHLLGELRQLNPELRIIGVNAYEEWGSLSDEQRLRGYLAQHAPWLQVVPGSGHLLATLGGVPKIPSLFLFDAAGVPVVEFQRKRRAPPTRDELAHAISRAMGCPAGEMC